jgi:sec-independent protein translocase protein TatA
MVRNPRICPQLLSSRSLLMLGNLNGWHTVILLAVILLLFGAPRIPALAKSLGQALEIFRSEVKPKADDASANRLDEDDQKVE